MAFQAVRIHRLKIAIIGAGLSGLTLAHRLQRKHEVTVFEKARGVGGRMSTRYTNEFQFDHGAQYFTARSQSFNEFLKPFVEKKTVSQWQPKLVTLSPNVSWTDYNPDDTYYVAAPKMNALCKSLAQTIDVQSQVKISKIERTRQGWVLYSEEALQDRSLQDISPASKETVPQYGPFDWVISSAPVAQSQALMPESFEHMSALRQIKQNACFALMLGFEQPLLLPFDAAKVTQSPIGWICVDSTKPLRDKAFSLLVHSTNTWAEANIEKPLGEVQSILLEHACLLLNLSLEPAHISLHRWRYANTPECGTEPYLIDKVNQLAVCGDGLVDGRVEGAFLSAIALADLFCE